LAIGGSKSISFRFRHADGSPYGSAVSPIAADHHAKAFFALTNLGYKPGEARRALGAVLRSCGRSHVGAGESELTLESLIRMALHESLPSAQGHASRVNSRGERQIP